MNDSLFYRNQRGVSVIEALVAFLVMAFGMLALAGMQITLRGGSDIAKQRSEAVRLAQEKMERLRDFEQLATATGRDAYNDVVTEAQSNVTGFSSNATFQIATSVATRTDPDRKDLTVTVNWSDRSGSLQSVSLDSVIAGINPAMSGRLSINPENYSPTRLPRDRALNIPYPAVDQGNGTSRITTPGGTVALYFNNSDGDVVRRCNIVASVETGCTSTEGYIISGYIHFGRTSGNQNQINSGVVSPDGSARKVSLIFGTLSSDATSYECFNDSSTQAVGWVGTQSYLGYLCVIYGDNDTSTPFTFDGSLRLATDGTWAVGTTATAGDWESKVCRYSFDYDVDNTGTRQANENNEHPDPYVDVDGNLLNQNFYVIPVGTNCPSDNNYPSPFTNPPRFANYNTIQLQP